MRKKSFNLENCGNILIWALLCIIIVFAAFRVFCVVNYFSVCVVGTSMEGTLHDGDCVYAFRSTSPSRGDIVIIETDDKPIIKRVIALGGDTVELRDGVLYLNGEKVDEPYVDPANNSASYSKNTFSEITVPEGKMFFMGDNRDDSNDSRSKYGVMPVSSIMGIVAEWSLSCKGAVTAFNIFLNYKVG